MSETDPTWPGDEGGATPPPPPPPPPAAPAPPGAPSAAPGGTAAADVGIRLGARIIDGVLLSIVTLAVVVPLVVGMMFADATGSGMMFGGGGNMAANLLGGLVALAINLGYYVFMDTRFGWTLGKKLLNLEVKGAAGGLPTVEESLKRNAWMALSIVPFLGGIAQLAAVIYIAYTISSSDQNIGWHDEFAGGTRVVRA